MRFLRQEIVVDCYLPHEWEEPCGRAQGGKIGEAFRYGSITGTALTRFLDDGRIEIDSNTVERSIRGLSQIGAEDFRHSVTSRELCPSRTDTAAPGTYRALNQEARAPNKLASRWMNPPRAAFAAGGGTGGAVPA